VKPVEEVDAEDGSLPVKHGIVVGKVPPRRRVGGLDFREGSSESPRISRAARMAMRCVAASLCAMWAIAWAAFAAARSETTAIRPSGVKAFIDRPGVYAFGLDRLGGLAGWEAGLPTELLSLTCRDRVVRHWLEVDGSGAERRLLFVADSTVFRPADLRDARPLRVVRLTWDDSAGSDTVRVLPAQPEFQLGEADLSELEEATVWRRLHLEQNVLRAAVTMGDADDVDTLWYWAMLTQQSSSQLEVEIGDLPDLSPAEGLDLEITLRLLGWSRTDVTKHMSQHHVDVYLNGRKIGESLFDGRRSLSFHFKDVPDSLLRPGSNRLRLKIPERAVNGSTDPLLDIVYLDWIEVRFRANSPLENGNAPLSLDASDQARWLPDPAGSPTSRLFAAAGWSAPRQQVGGWVLPPCEATEVWIVDDDEIRAPLAVEPLSAGTGPLVADAEYVMIAPPELASGAARLAEFHRSLGRTVAVVDPTAVYDEFGGGERSAEAIRRFLGSLYERTGRLRWVLLVGDADWFEPDDRSPAPDQDPTDRNRVPSWTFISRYGPAASDHFYASDNRDERVPRFAVGRLPVVDAGALDAYVSKVIAWITASGPPGGPSMLMLSDSSKGSRLQHERMRKRLADVRVDLFSPDFSSGGSDLNDAAIAAFGRNPSLVYFGGHGSRYMWELGEPDHPKPGSFFDREDVGRLEPTIRQPIVLSMSCATAPFDHPSADSLGEVMVLSGSRGAVAFVGASALLHTPPRFGEFLVAGLVENETLGDAFVAAKRRTNNLQVSHLYNLLGDPGLPLSTGHQDAGAEKQ